VPNRPGAPEVSLGASALIAQSGVKKPRSTVPVKIARDPGPGLYAGFEDGG